MNPRLCQLVMETFRFILIGGIAWVGITAGGGESIALGWVTHQTWMAQRLDGDPLGEVLKLKNAGRYPEAIAAAEALLKGEASTWGRDDLRRFNLLNVLGILHKAMGHWDQAEAFYQQILVEVDWPTVDPLGINRGVVLHNLAELYRTQGKYQEAGPLYEEALQLLEPELGQDNPQLFSIRNNQAEFFRETGDLERSRQLYLALAADRERVLGPNHPDLGTSWHNLAGIALDQGRLEEAKTLTQKALAVKQAAYGPNHPDVAAAWNLLGLIDQRQNQLDLAAQDFDRVLKIRTTLWGLEHPLIAHIFNNLALLAQAQQNFPQAKDYIAQALAIAQRTLGPNHPDTERIRKNQAALSVPPQRFNPDTLYVFRS